MTGFDTQLFVLCILAGSLIFLGVKYDQLKSKLHFAELQRDDLQETLARVREQREEIRREMGVYNRSLQRRLGEAWSSVQYLKGHVRRLRTARPTVESIFKS